MDAKLLKDIFGGAISEVPQAKIVASNKTFRTIIVLTIVGAFVGGFYLGNKRNDKFINPNKKK